MFWKIRDSNPIATFRPMEFPLDFQVIEADFSRMEVATNAGEAELDRSHGGVVNCQPVA